MTSGQAAATEITVRVDWQFRECARACRQIQRHRMRSRWWRILQPVLLVGLVLVILVALLGATIDGSIMQLLPWVLILLLWLALIAGGASWITAWHIRRNNPNMLAGFEHTLAERGYRVRCGNVDSSVAWAGFVKFVETRDFFLAYPTRTAAYYIPKRSLTPDQVSGIRQLIAEHASEKASLLAV